VKAYAKLHFLFVLESLDANYSANILKY